MEKKWTKEEMELLGEVINRTWDVIAHDIMMDNFSATYSHYEVANFTLESGRWVDFVINQEAFQSEILDPFYSMEKEQQEMLLNFALKMKIYGY